MLVRMIRCDRCCKIGATSEGPNRRSGFTMREGLKEDGWMIGNGKDFCNVCREIKRKIRESNP